MQTWHDLAIVYMKLSQWHDSEACLLKSETITYYSAPRLHITGMFTFCSLPILVFCASSIIFRTILTNLTTNGGVIVS